VKDALLVHAPDIHGLDHTIVKGEADAFSDVRSELEQVFRRAWIPADMLSWPHREQGERAKIDDAPFRTARR
jgi:hypothetical protein